jgi:hypothetical protein
VDEHLERGREHGEDPAARGGEPDVAVLRAGRGDVVLAGLPGTVDDLPVEEVEVPPHEVEDAPVLVGVPHEAGEEPVERARALRAGRERHDVGHQRRPRQAAVDDLEPEDDVDADAGLLETSLDGPRLLAAVAGVLVEGLQGRTDLLAAGPGVEERVPGAEEAMERGGGDGARGRARAQLPREPLRVDPRQQETEAVGEGPREGSGRLPGEPRLEESDEAMEVGERQLPEAGDVGLGAEEPGRDLDEVVSVPGGGDQPGRDAAPELGEKPLVARDADVAEERGGVPLREERRDRREEAVSGLRRRLERVEDRGDAGPRAGRAGRRRRRVPQEPDEGVGALLGRACGEDRLDERAHGEGEDSVSRVLRPEA